MIKKWVTGFLTMSLTACGFTAMRGGVPIQVVSQRQTMVGTLLSSQRLTQLPTSVQSVRLEIDQYQVSHQRPALSSHLSTVTIPYQLAMNVTAHIGHMTARQHFLVQYQLVSNSTQMSHEAARSRVEWWLAHQMVVQVMSWLAAVKGST